MTFFCKLPFFGSTSFFYYHTPAQHMTSSNYVAIGVYDQNPQSVWHCSSSMSTALYLKLRITMMSAFDINRFEAKKKTPKIDAKQRCDSKNFNESPPGFVFVFVKLYRIFKIDAKQRCDSKFNESPPGVFWVKILIIDI